MAATGVQGRAVMIDLHAHFGRERKMVGYEDLMGILEKDKVTVEQGDFVCLRTGFDRVLLEFDRKPDDSIHHVCAVLDGRDDRLQQWVTDAGLVALISDNYAVEAHPSRPCVERRLRLAAAARALPVPARRLSRRALVPERARRLAAREKRNRFLLTAPPLRLPGAVGSPATPAQGGEGIAWPTSASGWQIVTLIMACAVIAVRRRADLARTRHRSRPFGAGLTSCLNRAVTAHSRVLARHRRAA